MGKFDYRKLPAKERELLIDSLMQILHQAKNKDALQEFLQKLMTPSEIIMLARRWQAAQRLADGQSYYKISQELKIGIGTIESVDHWLSEAIGDYRAKLEKKRAEEKTKRLRRRRPTMFPNTVPLLLFNLLAEAVLQAKAAKIRARR